VEGVSGGEEEGASLTEDEVEVVAAAEGVRLEGGERDGGFQNILPINQRKSRTRRRTPRTGWQTEMRMPETACAGADSWPKSARPMRTFRRVRQRRGSPV
jgi:hypothetical protein